MEHMHGVSYFGKQPFICGPGNEEVVKFASETVQLLKAKQKLFLERPQMLHGNG